MPELTHNMGIKKPLGAEIMSRAAYNENLDIIDAHAAVTTHIAYAAAAGAANAYTATLNPAPTVYTEGMALAVKINADNTGASTINVNVLGAKTIKKANGNDVAAGNLKAGSIYTLRYNGVNFILQGEGGSGNAVAADVLVGKTFTNDTGDQTGNFAPKLPNLVKQGSFENYLNCWSGGILESTIAKFRYNSCKLQSPDGATVSEVTQPLYLVAGHKYYACGWFMKSGDITGESNFDIASKSAQSLLSANQASFEDESISWLGYNTATGMAITRDTTEHCQGVAGLKVITSVPGDNYCEFEPLSLSANTTYVYTAYVKIPATVTSGAAILRVIERNSEGGVVMDKVSTEQFTITNVWQKISFIFTTESNTSQVNLRLSCSGVGTVYWDNVYFKEAPLGNLEEITDITVPTSDTWHFLSNIMTAPADVSQAKLRIYTFSTNPIYCDGLMLIDLTDALNDAIPTKAQMDAIVQASGGWWDSDLLELTHDATASHASILKDKVAYVGGEKVVGVFEGLDTSDVTAVVGDLLTGKTAYTADGKITGTMPNHGASNITPTWFSQAIPTGYHSGGVVVGEPNLSTQNIRAGVSMFGIEGDSDVVDTGSGDAVAANVLAGKKAYAKGALVTGTMANQEQKILSPRTYDVAIPAGYHNGNGFVQGEYLLEPEHLVHGYSACGVVGTYLNTAERRSLFNGSNNLPYVTGYSAAGSPSWSMSVTSMEMVVEEGETLYVVSDTMLDLTDIKTLVIDWSPVFSVGDATGRWAHVAIGITKADNSYTSKMDLPLVNNARGAYIFDVGAATGEHYIKIGIGQAAGTTGIFTGKPYKILLA